MVLHLHPFRSSLELGEEVAEVGNDDGGEGGEKTWANMVVKWMVVIMDDTKRNESDNNNKNDKRQNLRRKRVPVCQSTCGSSQELPSVSDRPSQNAPEHIASAVVAGHASVRNGEGKRAGVVGDDTVGLQL